MRHKLLLGLAGVALFVGSAMTFKTVTGDCPLAWLMRHLHGHAEQHQVHSPS